MMLIRVAFTSPYWSLYDLFVSLFRKGATEELRGLIRKKTLSKEVMLFDSGTSAIYAALKTLKLKEGNLVAVPSFICRAVPRAIVAAGCIPFFIDIDDEYGVDYNSLKKAIKTRKIKAAIIVYQYGKVPSNTKKIISLCRQNNIKVIEDAAVTGLYETSFGLTGTLGDVSIISFNIGKLITGLGGGALILNDPKLVSRDIIVNTSIQPMLKKLNTIVYFLFRIKYKKMLFPFYYMLKKIRGAELKGDSDLCRFDEGLSETVTPYGIANFQAHCAYVVMNKQKQILNDCKITAEAYTKLLDSKKVNVLPLVDNTNAKVVIRVQNRDRLQQELLKKGIETQWTFYPCHKQRQFIGFPKTKMPRTDRVWKQTLMMPSGYNVPHNQIRSIAEVVNNEASKN